MFVLGTAGHIDHGKSSLIRAMTGIDPDRLPEEKERGMTIDLGFAWMTLPDGDEIGVVDVPGHERFVRNMVAGAGGINAAMLVVAADDGWMPQTQEHFDILRLLDIKHGLVAVTKTDLVDKEWLELVVADIATKLKGTFLEGASIIPVSSETGDGIPDVVAAIAAISKKLKAVEDIGKSRLFVDRAFVLTGIGVVVTGTSRGGGFSADSEVFHFPAGKRLRIRSLQSHERKVDRIRPGTRAAINLTGVDRADIRRGHVITGFEYKSRPVYLAVRVTNLNNSTITLKEGRKVLVILGTTETEAVIRPFEDTGIRPGESGLAILKSSQPLAAFIEDRFIVRLPTPQVTIGGGRILDILDKYPRRKDLTGLRDHLLSRAGGDLDEIILTEVNKRLFMPLDGLLTYSGFSADDIHTRVEAMIAADKIVRFETYVASRRSVNDLLTKIARELEKTHAAKSYLKGLTAEELLRRVGYREADQFQLLLKYGESVKALGRTMQFYSMPGFAPVLDDELKKQADRIMADAIDAGHSYLSIDDVESKHPGSRRTVNFLREESRLAIVGNQFLIPGELWRQIIAFIEEKLEMQDRLTVAEFRDRFGSSRKYALPVLEYLDNLGITRREGDYRVRGARYDERHSL